MLKTLLSFSLFFLPLFPIIVANEDTKQIPTENIDGGISSIVNGCVSAISGDYLESEVDLAVAGPKPLIF